MKGIDNVQDFLDCKPDIIKPEILSPFPVQVSDELTFIDRKLPSVKAFTENSSFNGAYFVNLHASVKTCNTHNYLGA